MIILWIDDSVWRMSEAEKKKRPSQDPRGPDMMSRNDLFCLANSRKANDVQFTSMREAENDK